MVFRLLFIVAGFATVGVVLVLGLHSDQNTTEEVKLSSEANESQAPQQPILNLENYIPEKPEINALMSRSVGLHEGTPKYLPPPFIPPQAEKSGHCIYELQINALGHVESILSLKCSDEVFVGPTRSNLMKWRFYPKKDENSKNQPFKFGPQKTTFKIVDSDNIDIYK